MDDVEMTGYERKKAGIIQVCHQEQTNSTKLITGSIVIQNSRIFEV